MVADVLPAVAEETARTVGAESTRDWRRVIEDPRVDAVVVSTPNGWLAEIATAALAAGKHVLVEKPMGRNLAEAERMCAVAWATGRCLKVGFNHRYHPAVAEAWERVGRGEIGRLINLRCRYGHGGRPGYEREWRADREVSGGGQLTDQGVHVIDLFQWFAGAARAAYARFQTAVWPRGGLEDNAFAIIEFDHGVVGGFHTSSTQWKNLFSFEVFGDRGALVVEGLGRSYGCQTLTRFARRLEGGPPDTDVRTFPDRDVSWELEWEDFLGAVCDGRTPLGTAEEGVQVMRVLDALYASAERGCPIAIPRCTQGVVAP